MRRIHDFKLPRETEVEETFTETDDKGVEKTITTKIKKLVDQKFFLQKPNRKLFDAAELYYAVKLSEGIKAGLLTRALLQKRFANDGGILSDGEKSQWNDLYNEVFEKQVQLQSLSLKTREERSSKENYKFDELNLWLKEARKEIQEFEMSQSSLYDQTAENRARNKTILWWVLHLSFQEDGEKESAFFGEGDFEQKLNHYDRIEELEEEWESEVISKFFYYVSFWYVSKTNSKEEFLEMLKYAEQQEIEGEGEEGAIEEISEADKEALQEEAKQHVEESTEKIKEKKESEEKPVEEKPAEEKPAEEKPAEEKPAEEKPAEEKPAEEKAPEKEEPKKEKKPTAVGKKKKKKE